MSNESEVITVEHSTKQTPLYHYLTDPYKYRKCQTKHSKITPIKQKYFSTISKAHLNKVKHIITYGKNSVWASDTYIYVDMTAGEGNGSPTIFWNNVKEVNVKYKAYFIDKNCKCIENLKEIIKDMGLNENENIVLQGDYDKCLLSIYQSFPKNSYGLIYQDLYGTPSDIFTDIFNKTNKNMGKIDILTRLPATSMKRSRGAHSNKKTLSEYIDSINKKYWFVTEPVETDNGKDRQQWTFLFGSNYDVEYLEFMGLYLIHSPEGMEILQKLNLTNKQLKELKNMSEGKQYGT
jgi:hypothetical protein